MPTYSSALNQEQPTNPQPRRPVNRPKEFWEVEPGDPETAAWQDNPEDPAGVQGVVITEEQQIQGNNFNRFDGYVEFVNEVTSSTSKDKGSFITRIIELQGQGCEIQRLMTAAVGMSAEAGEFMEIVKKITFQGKPWNADNIDHLKIELGDVMWYVAQACMALDVSIDEVLDRNIEKLSKRYPEGTFDAYYSENRKPGDR